VQERREVLHPKRMDSKRMGLLVQSVRSSKAPMGEKRKAVRVWMLGGFRVSVDSTTPPRGLARFGSCRSFRIVSGSLIHCDGSVLVSLSPFEERRTSSWIGRRAFRLGKV
jgi:hypothetical protein